jgi:hypothetical protein
MEGGTISGNSSIIGGGVYVQVNGGAAFKKTPGGSSNSGIIYGSEASGTDANGVSLKNTASSSSSSAVYAFISSSPSSTDMRKTTAGQTDYIDTSTGQGLSASGNAPFGP